MSDGIDHSGINMSGIGHEGGDTGIPDRQRIRAELAELTERVEALEQEQRERKMIP
jgi:hypothetical protein